MWLSDMAKLGVYANMLALSLLFGLIILSTRIVNRKHGEDQLFFAMCISVAGNGIFGVLFHLLRDLPDPAARLLTNVALALGKCCIVTLLIAWICYVDYQLNHSKARLYRRYKLMFIPLYALILLYLAEIPFDVVYTSVGTEMEYSVLYTVTRIVIPLYFLLSAVIFFRYRKKTGTKQFFHISPIVLPVVLGTIADKYFFYATESLGFVIAMFFLYFAMLRCWQYEVYSSGFYNRSYMDVIIAQSDDKEAPAFGAILFQAQGDERALTDILHRELPKDAPVIELGAKQYLMIAKQSNKRLLAGVYQMIGAAAAEYDEAHPKKPIALSAQRYIRKSSMPTKEWLEGIVQQREIPIQ